MSSEQWIKQHWRVVTALIVFVLFAPAPPLFRLLFVALPLAAMLATTPVRLARETIIAAIAGGLSLAWLLVVGDLPDQFLRSGALIAAAAFVLATWYTRSSLVHRLIFGAGLAAVGVSIAWLALGGSGAELQWWVEYRLGFLARLMSAAAWSVGWANATEITQLVDVFAAYVRFSADYFAAIAALQLMAGMAIAASIYRHLVQEPRGEPIGRWRDFRFTEHLGWAAVVSLAIVLIPQLDAARLGALNLLLVMGTLFAMRGAAVVTSGLQTARLVGCLPTALVLVSVFLMLPVAVVGAILLGIIDTGFDLRRRWQPPPVG